MKTQGYILTFTNEVNCSNFMKNFQSIQSEFLWLDSVIEKYNLDANSSSFSLLTIEDIEVLALILSNNIERICHFPGGGTINDIQRLNDIQVEVIVESMNDIHYFFELLVETSDYVDNFYEER